MSDLVTDQIGSLIRRLFQTINWKVSEIVLLIFNHKHAGSFGALAGFAIAVIFTWKFLKPAPGRQRRNRPKRRVPQSAAGGGEGSGVGSSSLDFSLEASLKDLVVVESPVELNHWQITRRKLNGARKVPPMPSNGLEPAAPVADKGDAESSKQGKSQQRKRKDDQGADLETKEERILEGGEEPNQAMVCTICNVVVNSRTVYDSHITGSKHAAMAKKQQEAAAPVADKGDAGCSKNRKRKEAQGADLETKMKRILEGGADPNQVMMCTICTVVVNNRTVYNSHITGSKHAAMVKKQQEAAAPVAEKGDAGSIKPKKRKEA